MYEKPPPKTFAAIAKRSAEAIRAVLNGLARARLAWLLSAGMMVAAIAMYALRGWYAPAETILLTAAAAFALASVVTAAAAAGVVMGMHNMPEIPQEAHEQLKALIETYERLQPATDDHSGSKAVIEELKDKVYGKADEHGNRVPDRKTTLWWTDLSQAELCIVDVLGDDAVRAHLLSWRRRFREVVGDLRYAGYIATAPNPDAATPQQVRADLVECIDAVYYFYAAYGVAARSRSHVTRTTLIVALAILAVLGILRLILSARAPSSAWIFQQTTLDAVTCALATSAFAVLGSIISVQRRLEDPKVDVDPFFRYITTHSDRVGIALMSPLSGAIFGLVIYGLLASHALAGNAFPTFGKDAGALLPENLKDYAFLFVYGFLAGFAEQFVPDALNRIAARALGTIPGAAAPGGPPAPAAPIASLTVSASALSVKAGATSTFTAGVPGSTAAITAASSDATSATVSPPSGTAPGPVTFTVTGVSAGKPTITVSSGTASQKVAIDVTPA